MPNGPGTGPSMQVDLPLPIDDNGKQRVFVNPRTPIRIGTSGATRAKEVKFTNNTGNTATLWFPSADKVFDATNSGVSGANPPPGVDFSKLIDIPPAGLTLKVRPDAPDGQYHYHVYCKATQDCAEGNSEPRIDVP